MTVANADRSFGNRGTLWSGVPVPYDYVESSGKTKVGHQWVGGTAHAIQVLKDGSIALVVTGWDGATPPTAGTASGATHVVRIVRFPADGQPQEIDRGAGTSVFLVSDPGHTSHSYPLACCATAANEVAILIRRDQPTGSSYAIHVVTATAQNPPVRTIPIDPSWLYDTAGAFGARGMRIVVDGADFALVSSEGTSVRCMGRRSGQVVLTNVDLVNTAALPGLIRLETVSLRFAARNVVIGLTAYLNVPPTRTVPLTAGPNSLGALLQLELDGSRDATFGHNGVWVSPFAHEGFVCAGEWDGVVSGYVDTRAIAFAVGPHGVGLKQGFGVGGVAQHDLGGPLASAVAASDTTSIYVFAQRLPTRTNPAGDLLTVGCRVGTTSGRPAYGQFDPGWGTSGTVTLHSDGAPLAPGAATVANAHVYVAGTRQLLGTDCDRIPVVTKLAVSNGDPDGTFGAGGFSLHGSISRPAIVAPDGSSIFVERVAGQTGHALRFVTAVGAVGALVPLGSLAPGAVVTSMRRFDGGILMLSGGESEPFVLQLDSATGAPVSRFGASGLALPKGRANQGFAAILGRRQADRQIALRVSTLGSDELTTLLGDGQPDANYGTGGFVAVRTFTHMFPAPSGASCFLADDDSVIVVISSEHEPAGNPPPVTVALRRVTPDGQYDPTFGLGLPGVFNPPNGRTLQLSHPDGATAGSADYKKIEPCGVAWMGGKLYVFATGWSGGRHAIIAGVDTELPKYPLLVVMRWNSDGSIDNTFALGGRQEAGYSPDHEFWSAHGVITETPTSVILYGAAAEVDVVSSSVAGGPPTTSRVVRQTQPAIFRIQHPTGLDLGFGGDGSATIRLPEVLLTTVAGSMVGSQRVRVACVDLLTQPPANKQPRTNQGGLVQWQLRNPRPPRPHP